jgi:hypothetical protein
LEDRGWREERSEGEEPYLCQIEYMVVACDDENKRAVLSLRQTEILQKLQGVTLDPKLEKYKPADWYVLSPIPGSHTSAI